MIVEKTKYRGIHLRRRADGSAGAYYIRVSIRGKQTWRRAGNTLIEARETQQLIKRARTLETLGVDQGLAVQVRFEELSAQYLEDYERRKGTENLARVRSSIKKLNGCFSHMTVSSIKEKSIDDCVLPRADCIMLKAILRRGERWGYLTRVPNITVPPRAKKIDRSLTGEELNSILAQAGDDHRDAIKLSLLLGGMRLGELCKITSRNTDFDAGYIDITKRKADQPKRFILLPAAAAILKRRFLANGGVAFKMTPARLSQMFLYERAKMQGVKPFRFHDLRHLTATSILASGADVETAREVLGHSSIRTTQLYLHSNVDRQRKALERFGEWVERVSSSGV